MTTLTEKFDAFEAQVAEQNAAILLSMGGINDTLSLLNSALDTLINNGATNTRYLLQAIAQNSPCADCEGQAIEVPPIDTTTRPINSDKCKRTQAFLNAMTRIFEVLDVMSAFSIGFQPNLITDAVNQVIDALGNGDTTPTISFPESVQLVGDGINYIAGNLLVGDTLASLFAAQYFTLRDAIYSATSADDARNAYNTIISASGIPSYAQPVIKDAAYSALWSYYFDTSTAPNLSGLDGSVCTLGPGGCYEFAAVAYTSSVPSSAYGLSDDFDVFTPGSTLNTTGGSFTFTPAVIYGADLFGWTIESLTPGVTINYQHRAEAPSSPTILTNDAFSVASPLADTPISVHTGTFIFFASDPFTLRLCPPEV